MEYEDYLGVSFGVIDYDATMIIIGHRHYRFNGLYDWPA